MNEQEKNEKLEKIENIMGKVKLTPEDKQFVFNELNAIIREFPNDVDALFWLGLHYQGERDYKTAISYYEKILEIAPNDSNSENVRELIKDCTEFLKFDKEYKEYKSGRISDDFLDKAPDLLTKLSPKWLLITKLIIIFVFIFMFCPALIFGTNDKKIVKNTGYYDVLEKTKEAQQNFNPSANTDGYQALRVNPISSYNYYSKRDIYNLRKRYVQTSLFASENYEPNESVFGNIVDGKPWLNINPCSKLNYKGDYHESIEGDSKLSVQINNPNALVGLNMVVAPWEYEHNAEFCNTELGYFVPTSLSYDKKENLIVAMYKVPSNYAEYRAKLYNKPCGYPIQLSGLNALDFGYDYVYALETRGITMMYPEISNMTTEVQTFRDYIHLGSSCKYEGGCNNISPMQNNLMFYVNSLPAMVTVKLWKKQPLNKSVKADFYYKIIIDD